MKKRSLLTSVIVSSVLVGALAFSGCGGSSSSAPKTLPSLGEGDTKASASEKIVADANGNLNTVIDLISENKKSQVAQVTFNKVLKDGRAGCTQTTDNCEVKAVQLSACGIKTDADAFTDAKSHVLDLISKAGDRYSDKAMVVFGGKLTISCSGFTDADLAISINMIKCGAAFKTDGTPVQSGFSNEGHAVDVYVKEDASSEGKWILNVKVKDGKILLSKEQLGTLELPVTFTFYSIYNGEAKDGTTGISGGTGAGGY